MSKFVPFPYDDKIDYMKLVIEYEKKFNSHEYKIYPPEEVWSVNRTKEKDNRLFYNMHCHNMWRAANQRTLAEEMKAYKAMATQSTQDFEWAFITLNLDDTSVTTESMYRWGQKVWEKPFIGPGSKMVYEKHRKDEGIHHHIHMLLRFNKEMAPSRVIDEIWKTKGAKNVIRDKNFIDYIGPRKKGKPHQPYETYDKYVSGIKRAEKMPYVELDRVWRSENKILDLYVKE